MKKTFLTLLMILFASVGVSSFASENEALKIQFDRPAGKNYKAWETQSLPIGNSAIGGNFFGRTDTEKITLNEKSFWTGGPSAKRPNYLGGNIPEKGQNGKALREIQKLFLDGKVEEGSRKMGEHLIGLEEGFGGYQLFGNLLIDVNHLCVFNYNRSLDLMNGMGSVSYRMGNTLFEREYFASYPDKVMAVHFTAKGKKALYLGIRLNPSPNDPGVERKTFYSGDDSSMVMNGYLEDNGLQFSSYLKVLTDKGAGVTRIGNVLKVNNAKEVTLLLSMGTDYANDYPKYRTGESQAELDTRVQAQVEEAAQKGYAELRKRHIADFSALMNRLQLRLQVQNKNIAVNRLLANYNNGFLNREEKNYLETLLYQYGRYLLVSSSRGETLPANLQGLWVGKNNSMWNSDYHLNVNLQMNYWPAYSGNLVECSQPLINYIDSLREPGRVTAKVYFGVESTPEKPENGFVAHTQNSPYGWTCPGWSVDWGWSPAATPWILQNCWEHYEYTEDLAYMKEKIYPMLKEELLFYSQIMVQDKDGKWLSTPAYSPEQGPRTNGNTYEQSLIWQLFTDTITAAKLVGEDPDLVAEWQAMLDHLKDPIEIGADGQVKEWYHETTIEPFSRGHRHLSHMLGLYPGDLISKETPEWFNAARVSMENRVDQSTGWAMGQRINTWARLRDGNKAHELIGMLFKRGINQNLWDVHPPFQIDGNFGYTAGVNEMLMQSNMGYIDILPALPDDWATGEVDGLLARGNFEVGMSWNEGKVQEIRLLSKNGGLVELQIPGVNASSTQKISIVEGSQIKIKSLMNEKGRIQFQTKKGERYTVSIE